MRGDGVGRRIARWYPWTVGLAGIALLIARLVIDRAEIPALFRGEYLVLFAMFAAMEINRMPIRAGVSVGFSFIAVVAASLLGGDLPALVLSLGGMVMWAARRTSLRSAVFNTGTYALAVLAASLSASGFGHPLSVPTTEIDTAGLLLFICSYAIVNALVVGAYSLLISREAKALDHLYNFGLYVLHMLISASLGTSIALACRTFGPTNLYFMCATLSVMAFLISMGSKVATNREGLFGLYQAASSINEALTLKEVFERAQTFTGTLVDEDFAWLLLPTGDDAGGLTVAYTWAKDGVDLDRAAAHAMTLHSSRGSEARSDQFVWSKDPDSQGKGYLEWAAATPLHLGKQYLGEFGIASLSTPQEVSADKLQLLAVLSSHLALAVDNALKFERATMLAFTDPLTGLYNYRQFHNLLREAIVRAEKSETPVSLIYVDLDYFRNVNNTYGHQVGDEALKGIGRVIRASCRDKDLVCRPGGDEFTVILPGVSKENARVIAARVKENLIDASLEVGLPQPLVRAIGASVGVSTYPEDGSDVDTLVRKADADMYASKTEGGRGAFTTA